jgi:hypothetical protein
MTPIYFPHTYIPEAVANAVHTYFSSFMVCTPSQGLVPQAMREWQQDGLIEILEPSNGDEERLLLLLKDFHNWATLHGDGHHSGFDYFRSHKGVVPFFDDTSVTKILADIKRETPNDLASSEARYYGARVFLSIAQEMDAEADSLAIDMQRHHELEKRLFNELAGDDKPVSAQLKPMVSEASAHMDYMMAERLMAWWLLVSGITKQTGGYLPAVFVTANRPAIDNLVDLTTEAQKIITLEGIPAAIRKEGENTSWHRELLDRLRTITIAEPHVDMFGGMDWPAAPQIDHRTAQLNLTIYLITGQSPSAFFNSTICQTDFSDNEQELSPRAQSTVLALIEA